MIRTYVLHFRLDKCTSLHRVVGFHHSLQPLQMPQDGTVKVCYYPYVKVHLTSHELQLKVHHVANATRLWVSLLDHLPLRSGDEPVTHASPSTYTQVSLELTQHFSDIKERKLHGMYHKYDTKHLLLTLIMKN